MADKKKEQAMVVSQEQIADGIFSMWIHTEAAQRRQSRDSLFLCIQQDGSKVTCRVRSVSVRLTKRDGRLRVVYSVTGEKTGTEEFSKLKTGDSIPDDRTSWKWIPV